MNRKAEYRQCGLMRTTCTGTLTTVAYIPTTLAKVGRLIRIKDKDGAWSPEWMVVSAGAPTCNPPDWRKLIRGHRKMTGDSTPRTSVPV